MLLSVRKNEKERGTFFFFLNTSERYPFNFIIMSYCLSFSLGSWLWQAKTWVGWRFPARQSKKAVHEGRTMQLLWTWRSCEEPPQLLLEQVSLVSLAVFISKETVLEALTLWSSLF